MRFYRMGGVSAAGGAVDRDGAAVWYPPSRTGTPSTAGMPVLSADHGGVRRRPPSSVTTPAHDSSRTVQRGSVNRQTRIRLSRAHRLFHRSGHAGDAADGTRARRNTGHAPSVACSANVKREPISCGASKFR